MPFVKPENALKRAEGKVALNLLILFGYQINIESSFCLRIH